MAVGANDIDLVLTYLIYAALGGLGLALMMYVAASVGRRSARGAGIVAGISALLYVGIGVAGAAIRVEMGITTASSADPEVSKAGGDEAEPVTEEEAQHLRDALADGDWEAAAAAHDALKVLDPGHAALAPAWAEIEAGQAAAPEADSGGTGTGGDTEDEGSESGSGTTSDDTGGSSSGEADEDEIEIEPEGDDAVEEVVEEPKKPKKPRKRKKKKRRRPPKPAGDGGGDEPTEPATDEPTEPKPKKPALLEIDPEPDPEPEPEPKPEPKPKSEPEPKPGPGEGG